MSSGPVSCNSVNFVSSVEFVRLNFPPLEIEKSREKGRNVGHSC